MDALADGEIRMGPAAVLISAAFCRFAMHAIAFQPSSVASVTHYGVDTRDVTMQPVSANIFEFGSIFVVHCPVYMA